MGDKVDSAATAENAVANPSDGEVTKTDVTTADDKKEAVQPATEQPAETKEEPKTEVKNADPAVPETPSEPSGQNETKADEALKATSAPDGEVPSNASEPTESAHGKSEETPVAGGQEKAAGSEPQTQVSDASAQSADTAAASDVVDAPAPESAPEKPAETEVRDDIAPVTDAPAGTDDGKARSDDKPAEDIAEGKTAQESFADEGAKPSEEDQLLEAAPEKAADTISRALEEASHKESTDADMPEESQKAIDKLREQESAASKTDETPTEVRDAASAAGAPTTETVSKDVPDGAGESQANEELAREPQQSTPSSKSSAFPSSKPGDLPSQFPKTSAPPPKPPPAGHVPPFLQNAPSSVKGSSTPWASTGKVETPSASKPTGPVQMVGSHEDSAEQLAESSEEYRKQFSDRKKFFKQQMEQEETIPIKVAAPPPTFRAQAPVAAPEIPVVLSQPKVPEALKTPLRIEELAPSPTVLRSTGSQYSPAAMAAAEAAVTPPQPTSPTPPPPPQKPDFSGQTNLQNGYPQTTPLISSLASPVDHYAPTPFHTPETTGHAGGAPMWSPPGANSTPSQSGAQTYSPGVTFPAAPSFNARPVSAPYGGSPFDQPSKPVPFGQQRSPGGLPPAFAHQQSPVRTPSPTFNLQQQQQPPVQQKPSLAMSHNQFSAPQSSVGGYTPPGYQTQPLGQSGQNYAPTGVMPPAGSQARLPDLTELIGMPAPGKKKTFVDSSFYAGNELYPTFEEQVKLCHDISTSLTSEDNKQSLGARMFTRRKITSKKWTVEGGGQRGVNGDQWESADENDLENEPPKPNALPPMKYYMSPKGVDDAQSLMQKDPDVKIYDAVDSQVGITVAGKFVAVTVEMMFEVFWEKLYDQQQRKKMSPISLAAVSQGLESTAGRGVDLFQKRKMKSEEWVVDETNVKKAPPPPLVDVSSQGKLKQMLNSPSVLYVKSPWEAALESPIGSCETAFQSVKGGAASNMAPVLTNRTPSPALGFNQFQPSASPAPPQADNFSRLPRGWGPAASSPAPSFEPAPLRQPPSPAPREPSPFFKPPTPEPTAFKPQFQPAPFAAPAQPAPVHSVYRAAPPPASDFNMYNDANANIAMDAEIPNYQPAPQSVVRRFSQPQVEMGAVKYYPPQQQPAQQQPPWLQQKNVYRDPSPQGRHVTWHPQLKQVDHFAPQSTDEFRRQYNMKHQMWERPPEPVSSFPVRPRSRSQPPARYDPNQQRGLQPSYQPSYASQQQNSYASQQQNSSSGKRWGDNMANWRAPVQSMPAQQQQQQPSYQQPKPASPSRPGSWGADMHNWSPRPQQPSQPVYRPQQQVRQQAPGSWGSDMNNWRPRAASQSVPRFQPQQQQSYSSQPVWNSGANQQSNRQQQFSQPQQQQQQYGAMPGRQSRPQSYYGGSGGSPGGLLISDL